MQNEEIAKVFDEIGDALEIAGENFFRVRAYRNAARAIRDQPVAVAELSKEEIDKIPGIGADLAEKIATVVKTGDLPMRRELAAKFPPELLELTHVPGLGPKRVKQLADELRIRNRDDLARAARAGAIRTIRGLGPKIEERILEALSRRGAGESKRMRYAEAARIADRLGAHMREC